ncbi:uncharacterized protein B0I36DRAFT_355098 [Microdochium trichocladiopsis]|uniref:Uncharacterized protein n=1 Tax=Microdochium trichocladiopsis TaxID=1682393 RepID=A0A9P8XW89_9PEZI|nr:uncharacterized protein B0I36DRAFT_355098 [Microdochium trichocladiopsis]KAH7016280.1 hypothetical protein B0I36DRAFT_355098 [Microdochium trichocladiopsis]
MGPPAMGQYESSAILTDRSGSETLSPKHGSGSGFQMGPWKQSSEEAPSLTGFHGFSPETHHHPTEWPQSMGTVTSGASSVRAEDKWDPSLHSPARTMSYESEDSAAPHYVMLDGHDPHRGSFDRRSSMGPDMYAPSIVSSSMASPVEAHHAQVGMGPAPRPQGITGPAYPWLEQQPYPYASKPASEYGPTRFVNHNNNNSPYHQPAIVKQHLEHGHHVSHAMGEAHYYEGSKRV